MAHLDSRRFGNAEHMRTVWHVDSAQADTIADLMTPSYWAHVARHLRAKDRIEVACEDNSYFAELYVFWADTNSVKVGLLRFENFAENAAREGISAEGFQEYTISHGGNFHKWRVVRAIDSVALVSGLVSEKDAQDWLLNYRKALAK